MLLALQRFRLSTSKEHLLLASGMVKVDNGLMRSIAGSEVRLKNKTIDTVAFIDDTQPVTSIDSFSFPLCFVGVM